VLLSTKKLKEQCISITAPESLNGHEMTQEAVTATKQLLISQTMCTNSN